MSEKKDNNADWFARIIALLSLAGAIQMWKLKKLGFYIYAAANVIMLVMGFGIFALIVTAAFLVMYYLNLKAME